MATLSMTLFVTTIPTRAVPLLSEIAESNIMHPEQPVSRRTRKSIPISGKLDDRENVRRTPYRLEELPISLRSLLAERGKESSGGGGRSTLEILESKHVISILMYLDEMSPVLKSDIYNNLSRSATMAEKIEDLRKIGRVDVYWTAKANTNVVVITDKGRRIAGMFREILDLVGNDE